MVRIELTDDEAQMLRQVLESYLSDLRMEIADTDSWQFREQLKEKELFLKRILRLLGWEVTYP